MLHIPNDQSAIRQNHASNLIPLGRFDPFIYPIEHLSATKRRIFSLAPAKARTTPALAVLKKDEETQPGMMSIERALGSLKTFGEPLQDLDAYIAAMAAYGYTPDVHRTFRRHIVELGHFKIERTLRSKSDLDFAFFFGSHQCYGEAYKLGEFSKNRSVLCLDMNSMFPWILKTARFPNPSKLTYREGIFLLGAILSGAIDNGIFRCHIRYLPAHRAFLNRFAPLYFGRHGISHPVAQEDGDSFDVLLHACEIKVLARMCEIDVLGGVYSEESIAHPLAGWVDRYYAAKQHGTPHERQVAKAALTSLHTCASRVSTEKKWLAPDQIEQEFAHRFGAEPFTSTRYAQLLDQKDNGAALMSLYRVDNDRNVYSLASTVYAEARARMLALFAQIDGEMGATICYSNIDSLHLSVRSDRVDALLAHIHAVHGVGPSLGQLKVEAVGRAALWLDAGVYWIADDSGRLIKHASIQTNPAKAFALSLRYLATDPITHEKVARRLRLFKTLGVSKELGPDGRWQRLPAHQFFEGTYAPMMRRLVQHQEIRRAFDRMRTIIAL
jgi:hypothetical protein